MHAFNTADRDHLSAGFTRAQPAWHSEALPGRVPAQSVFGSCDLWHAVHVGNEPMVQHCINTGVCNATMRDSSNHSVLWHAIAFNHMEIAILMLDRFPPGSDGGVDVLETHE